MLLPAILATRFWLHDLGSGSPSVTIFTDAEIQEFLDLNKVNDSSGYHPASTYWIPTYDVLKAAGYGWLWLAGTIGNKSLSYTIGDVSVSVDKNYCLSRARDLLGSSCATATRRDEPYYERYREVVYDGEDPRHRT